MASASRRYFPGRAPTPTLFNSDGSDEDDHDKIHTKAPQHTSAPTATNPSDSASLPSNHTKTTDAPTAVPQRRRRIAARVVSSPSPSPQTSDVKPPLSRRGTNAGFVPVKPSATQKIAWSDELRQEAHDSSSHSSDESSTSSHSATQDDDDDEKQSSYVQISNNYNDDERDADDSEEDEEVTPIHRPQFVHQNLNASQRERYDEEHRAQQREKTRRELRHQEAKRLVTRALREEQQNREADTNILPDDEDRPEDHDADYALWKVREILRIHRDREEQRAWEHRGTAFKTTSDNNMQNTGAVDQN